MLINTFFLLYQTILWYNFYTCIYFNSEFSSVFRCKKKMQKIFFEKKRKKNREERKKKQI